MFLVAKTSSIMQKKHPLHKKYFILSFLKKQNKRRRYIQGGDYIKMT